MDEQLAQIYGTGQTDAGDDLQKTAAAELLVKLAEQEGVDLNSLSDEQVTAMVQELFKTAEELPPFMQGKKESGESSSGESSSPESKETKEEEKKEPEKKEEPKEASAQVPTEVEKEAQAKFAEADFLGRAMAHAFVQEVGLIQKEAAAGEQEEKIAKEEKPSGGKFTRAFGRAGLHGAAGEAAGAGIGAGVGALAAKALKKSVGRGAGAGGYIGAGLGAAGGLAHGARKGWREGKATEKALAEKKASAEPSALEAIVDQTALELLKTAGYVTEQGEVMPPPSVQEEVKQASAFDVEVTRLALQKLESLGYPVKW